MRTPSVAIAYSGLTTQRTAATQEAGNESGKSVTLLESHPVERNQDRGCSRNAALLGDVEEWSEATRKPEVAKLLVPLGPVVASRPKMMLPRTNEGSLMNRWLSTVWYGNTLTNTQPLRLSATLL